MLTNVLILDVSVPRVAHYTGPRIARDDVFNYGDHVRNVRLLLIHGRTRYQ